MKFEIENFEHLLSNTRAKINKNNYVGISPAKNGFFKIYEVKNLVSAS